MEINIFLNNYRVKENLDNTLRKIQNTTKKKKNPNYIAEAVSHYSIAVEPPLAGAQSGTG